jgi:xeroderma pigmentosum group C-complementing protein
MLFITAEEVSREDPTTTPPVFWTEVFSRPDSRWIPVDPIRCIVNKRKVFDPSSSAVQQQRTLSENRMVYVLAFEEDGYARDVTRRYAREYGAKVAKVQLGGSAGKGGRAKEVWWQGVLGAITRPYRLVCGPRTFSLF